MISWVTISSLATAGGTLLLAVATFSSVRSANRAARVAEDSLLAGTQPLLMPSRSDDPPLKVGFADNHFVTTPSGGGTAEVTDDAIYLTMSVRNVGSGIAVLHGWRIEFEREMDRVARLARPALEDFRRLSRDLYIAAGEVAFWQGAFRPPSEPDSPSSETGSRSQNESSLTCSTAITRGDSASSAGSLCSLEARANGSQRCRSIGTSTAPTLADGRALLAFLRVPRIVDIPGRNVRQHTATDLGVATETDAAAAARRRDTGFRSTSAPTARRSGHGSRCAD